MKIISVSLLLLSLSFVACSEVTSSGPSTNNSASDSTGASMTTQVVIKTSKGDINVALNAEKAPISVANFLEYVKAGHYDGTIFHRVIPNFMVQGGGMDSALNQKPTRAPIAIEADNGLNNDRGTIAMARTNVPDSATSQFFINVIDNDFLNHRDKTMQGWGYAVFGEVTSGMDVVDAIAAVATGSQGPMRDVPKETITINSVSVIGE